VADDPLVPENVRAGLRAPKDIKNVVTVAISFAALVGETDYRQLEMLSDELLAELTRRQSSSSATSSGVRVGPYIVDRDTFIRELRRAIRVDPQVFLHEIRRAARIEGKADYLS
jgi:hypothetical protein